MENQIMENQNTKPRRELVSRFYLTKYLRVTYKTLDSILDQLGITPTVVYPSGPRYSLTQISEKIKTNKK